jgi:hypothetical protein
MKSTTRHPEESEWSCLKVMVFWITPLIKLANKRQILESDVWNCPTKSSVEYNEKNFRNCWEDEKVAAVLVSRPPSLTRALFISFGYEFLMAGFYQFCFMCSQIAQPFLVGALVEYAMTGNNGFQYGIGLALGLGAVSLVSSLALSSGLFTQRVLGGSIRCGVMMAVYQHALLLTSGAKQQNTVGQITNLIAIDSEKLFLALQFLHFLWFLF